MIKADFVARVDELRLLRSWLSKPQHSQITAVHGRRRVGKTRLVEEAFKGLHLLKFEGLEGENTGSQQSHFIATLARLSGNESHAQLQRGSWTSLLIALSEFIGQRPTVVFLDEFQWMAAERQRLVSELKFVWDNYFAKLNRVHLILCGSISSFIVKKVIQSRALYGRIRHEIELKPLNLPDVAEYFFANRSRREALDYYLISGGIPQYLQEYDPAESVRQSLFRLCFTRGGYLLQEFRRLFVSHFGRNPLFEKIVRFLAGRSFATRDAIAKHCRASSGGGISRQLEDLCLAGFVERYPSIHKPESHRLQRFRLGDPYLRFYFQFIHPQRKAIESKPQGLTVEQALPAKKLAVWRGIAFEHLCLQHAHLIAKRLDFAAVEYSWGSFFQRASSDTPRGFQIDLIFKRADEVFTVCELKYADQVGVRIIAEVDRRVASLVNPRGWTVEKVLITVNEPSQPVRDQLYFSRILTLADLLP